MQRQDRPRQNRVYRMEDRIKVLHILHEIHPSGAEMMIRNAYPYWEQECDCTIMATGRERGPFAGAMEKRGYEVVHVPTPEGGKAAKLKHLFRFRKYMKSHHYDVVHIHRESLSAEYALICRRTGSRNIVRTVHSTFGHQGLQRKLKAASRAMMRRRLHVRFVAISDGVAANERKVFGNPCDEIIYNWCDNRRFRYVSAEEKQAAKEAAGLKDKMTLVTVGSCGEVKNHSLLLRAIAQMKFRDRIFYHHVGYAPQETENEQALAQEFGIGGLVSFAGIQDPMPYLRQADLYLMTSRYEGLSVAALEAVFTGMQVLLADVPGLGEFKDKGLYNVNYFSYTPEALAEALDQKVRDWEAGRLQPDETSAARAEELYDIERQVHKYTAVYRKLTEK